MNEDEELLDNLSWPMMKVLASSTDPAYQQGVADAIEAFDREARLILEQARE